MATLRNMQQVHAAGLIGLAVIGGGTYLAGVSPVVSARAEQSDLTEQIRQAEQALQTLKTESARKAQAVQQAQAQLQSVSVPLRAPTEINRKMSELLARIAQVSLTVESQQQGPPAYKDDLYGAVPIQLLLRGTYAQFAQFLADLATPGSDLGVEAMELSGNIDDAQPTGPSMRIRLNWFVQPQDTPVTPAKKP